MNYLFLIPSVLLFVLAYNYQRKFVALRGTGKVTKILIARQRFNLCLALGILTAFIVAFFFVDTL